MTDNILFEEKQFLGRNRQSNFIKIILSGTCFAAYYWSTYQDFSGKLFLILGISIIVFSIFLTFLLHFKTSVYDTYIELISFFALRKVKIPLKNIISAKLVDYDEFYINNAVFNLHLKGKIHFYTNGNDAIKLTDSDGLIYLIGTQQKDILFNIIQQQLKLQK